MTDGGDALDHQSGEHEADEQHGQPHRRHEQRDREAEHRDDGTWHHRRHGLALAEGVQARDRQRDDRHGDCEGERDGPRPGIRVALHDVDGGRQRRPDRGDRSEHRQVPVAEEPDRTRVLDDARVVAREVRPPEREDDEEPAEDERGELPAEPGRRGRLGGVGRRVPPGAGLGAGGRGRHRPLDRLHRGEDHLTEDDDRQQPVALGDVVRMEGRVPVPLFCEQRHEQLEPDEQEEGGDEPGLGDAEACDPEQLDDGDAPGVPQRGLPPLGVAGGRPQPQRDHGEPHDRVAQHHRRRLAVGEDVGHPGREEQRADHDDEGEQAEDDVVVVVRRREPRVVHPRPPDREPGHRVADDRRVVRVGEPVVQLGRVARDGDDEDEVEEQLERGGGTVRLVGVARDHGSAQRHGHDAHAPEYAACRTRLRGEPPARGEGRCQ